MCAVCRFGRLALDLDADSKSCASASSWSPCVSDERASSSMSTCAGRARWRGDGSEIGARSARDRRAMSAK
eukprot:3275438-Pleurochrysis_carterae.AAC.1